jgi:release factor glutamine methyltransferase
VNRLRTAGCVFAEDEARLLASAARDRAELAAMVDRRVSGDPLEYVIGWAEFCGLRIAVERGVFVPRHRTEFLVAEAAARTRPGDVVVDMCCGSGAVGAAVSRARPGIDLHAADVEPAAVECARRNLAEIGAQVYHGDMYQALPSTLRSRVDVLVANVPYVPTADIELLPREARDHEPRVSLDGGGDGLDVARRLVGGALDWLAPGGHLLVETSDRQARAALGLVSASGLTARIAVNEELEATVVIGTNALTPGRAPAG